MSKTADQETPDRRGNGELPPPNSEPLTTANAERFRAVGTNYVVQSKELLTTVRITVPGKQVFIRTHPDPELEFTTHTFETKDGHALIEPSAFDAIRAKVPDFHKFAPCVSLRPYITKAGSIGLWPLKREGPFSIGGNSYNTSAFNASDKSRTQWVRVSSDRERGEWVAYDPDEIIPDPKWPPDLTMLMLIEIAAKGGVIDGPDHILIRPGLNGVTPFRSAVSIDFEFRADPGCRPHICCLCAKDLTTGETKRWWRDELLTMRRAPFPTDRDTVVFSYAMSAEMACFLELNWRPPEYLLDLYAEYRCITNGVPFAFAGKDAARLKKHKFGMLTLPEGPRVPLTIRLPNGEVPHRAERQGPAQGRRHHPRERRGERGRHRPGQAQRHHDRRCRVGRAAEAPAAGRELVSVRGVAVDTRS